MVMAWGSEAQEDFTAVHPVGDEGDDEEAGDAGHDALHFGAEEEDVALAEVGLHGLGEPDFQGVAHEVEGEGIHADDDEEEGPATVLLHIDELMKCGEEEHADAAAEEDPGRGPEVFDDGTDAAEVEGDAGEDTGHAGDEKSPDGSVVVFDPGACDEAEDHGGDGGDEVEGGVAAEPADVRGGAGEVIQEPDVEGPACVAVVVPVGKKSVEVVSPACWDVPGGGVGVRGDDGVEGVDEPVQDDEGGKGGHARAGAAEGEGEHGKVGQAHLREGFIEGPERHLAVEAADEDAETDESEGTPEGVPGHLTWRVAFGGA